MSFLWENRGEVAQGLLALLAVAEIVVRLTPTKKDDGAVERLGSWIRRTLGWMRVPNARKQ